VRSAARNNTLSRPVIDRVAVAIGLVVLAASSDALAAPSDAFSRALSRGPVYAGLAAFVGGLLVCLTPCVYPMIAITVSVFGAKQSKSRLHAMGLSTSFVLGIAAMFTPLGVAAGYTGSLFGMALSSPWVTGLVAVVFFALALSMLGVFEMVLPSGVMNRLAAVGGSGYGGAFLVGLVSGLVAAPCTGPVLTGILLWIGETKSAVLGAGALFAFSLGLGVPFWVVGTFAVHLPKSGRWTVAVQSFLGIVLAVAALHFLGSAVPQLRRLARPGAGFALACAALFVAGLATGAVRPGKGRRLRRVAAVVASVVGLFLLVSWLELPEGELEWERSEPAARAKAFAQSRPLLIDFTATWCGACGELSRETFADPWVVSEAQRFVAVKVDVTNENDAAVVEITKRYRIVGLPTVILIGGDGRERRRFTDFVPPDRFLQALRQVN
jgi:thioredoxin:protein disulfide reductase